MSPVVSGALKNHSDMEKIVLKDKELVFKIDLKSFIVYERMAGRSFEGKMIIDTLGLMYGSIISHNKDVDIEFDEFVDIMDGDQELFERLLGLVSEYFKAHASRDTTKRD